MKKKPTLKSVILKSGKLQVGKPKFYTRKADTLAAQYKEAGRDADLAEVAQAKARESIFELAGDNDAGVDEKGTTFFKVGDVFKVGFTNVMSTPTIDEWVLVQMLPAPVVAKFMVKQPDVYKFDEAAFIKLVEDGSIDKVAVAKATIPAKFKHKRIVVEKLKP